MNVSLTPKLEEFVREKVDSGLYNSASEVVREALRLLDERDRERRLHEELAIGLAQIERGETVPWNAELLETLKRESEANAVAGKHMNDAVIP
jgi:antitoxin ParD1/3/4